MKCISAILCASFRRAVSCCRGRLLKACTILLSTAVALAAALWFAVDWPEDAAGEYTRGVVLRDSAGETIRVSLGPGDIDRRAYYEADPEDWIVKAAVASEDGEFWNHRGVRFSSAARAAWQNIVSRRRISGASTITMQTVRLLKPHPKNLFWKCKEAVMALKMERSCGKLRIVSEYLNRAPFGSNFVGIEAAANGWFGKSAKSLGLGEAALLAGMLQAPSRFRPDRNLAGALRRRDYVLSRMRDLGMIDPERMQAAQSVIPRICRTPRPFRHPYFCDWAMERLRERRGRSGRGGDFTTSLDADIQRSCDAAVRSAAEKGAFAVAAAVMRVSTGEIVALSSGADYFDPAGGQVNVSARPRSAGSTLKPFLAAAAIDRGVVAPDERLTDMPRSYKGYRPANFDSSYRGSVSLRTALVLSLNLPFVDLLRRTGVERFAAVLGELGFGAASDGAGDLGLGLAIGNADVSLIELVAAYGAIARGGVYLPPVAFPPPSRGAGGRRVFSEAACYIVSDMLSGPERSFQALSHVADVVVPRFAWKTGTSSAYRDAWTVAWNPEYVVGVWCGHMKGDFGDKSVVGAKAAAPVAWQIARSVAAGSSGAWYERPAEVVERTVCSLTGLPASPECLETEKGIFVEGKSSPALCPVHIRDAKGRRSVRTDLLRSAAPDLAFGEDKLAITSPVKGEKFIIVPGALRQKIVCRAAGNAPDAKLWWFVDDIPAGETVGAEPFVSKMSPGEHTVTCSMSGGACASTTFTVEEIRRKEK